MPTSTLTAVAIVGVSFVVLTIAVLALLGVRSRQNPPDPGRLQNFSLDTGKPNYVSSLAESESRRVPPISFHGDPDSAWNRLQSVVENLPRTTLIESTPDTLHAECKSLLFGFVDDLEVKLQRDQSLIHIRSASRVGHSDLGANAKRIDLIRRRFHSAPTGSE